MDSQSRRGRRVHVRPQHLPGEPGRRRLLRKDGQGDQPGRVGAGAEDAVAPRRRPRLPHHRRHHALAQPVRGGVLPRGAGDEPHDARDVLPDGGAPRAPFDALPGRRRHDGDHPDVHRLPRAPDEVRRVHEARRADARRPLRLFLPGAARLREGGAAAHPARLLGCVPGSGGLQLQVPGHDRLGPEDVRHPGGRRGRQAGDDRSGGDQPRDPDPARQLVLRRLDRPEDVRHPRSARQPRGSAASVEPAHDSAPAEARLRSQLHVGDVAALVRRQGLPAARHRRRPDRAALGHGARRPRRYRLRPGDRAQREDQPAEDGAEAGDHVRMEDPEVEQRHRARSGPHLLPGVRGRLRAALLQQGARADPDGAHQDVGAVHGARGGDRLRLHRGGARRAVAPRGDSRPQDRELPPVPADAVEREPARRVRHGRPLRGRHPEHADLRGERPRHLQGDRHHARRGRRARPAPSSR